MEQNKPWLPSYPCSHPHSNPQIQKFSSQIWWFSVNELNKASIFRSQSWREETIFISVSIFDSFAYLRDWARVLGFLLIGGRVVIRVWIRLGWGRRWGCDFGNRFGELRGGWGFDTNCNAVVSFELRVELEQW